MTQIDFEIFIQNVKNPAILNVLKCIHDHLLAQNIEHHIIEDETSAQERYVVGSCVNGIERIVYVFWYEPESSVCCLGYDFDTERYKIKEGFSEEEAMTFIRLKGAIGAVEWLNGIFSATLRSAREKLAKIAQIQAQRS